MSATQPPPEQTPLEELEATQAAILAEQRKQLELVRATTANLRALNEWLRELARNLDERIGRAPE